MKQLIVFLSILLAFSNCKKDKSSTVALNTDYFAFGTAYGFCAGNCATFFLIKENVLYPDSMDKLTSPLLFNNKPMSEEKLILASKLKDNFPKYLLDNPNSVIGCPDCHDQGGIYIELRKEGTLLKWSIDTDSSQQPIVIRSYIQSVADCINNLK
jgi:hypothetical protein